MRRAQFLLIVALLFLCASGAVAQSPVQNDGAVVEQVPCAPNTIGTYEQYLESSKRTFADEVEAAKKEGEVTIYGPHNPVYQQVCLESPRKWRRANPDYWKKYRQAHPEQVERNCRKQRCRDQKRRLVNLANNNLATCKALSFQSLDSSELASSTSCKQHPFEIAPSAGL